MPKNWKKEIARDTIALGSIPFYSIVIIRAVIGRYSPFVYQLLIALAIIFVLSKLKNANQHIARGLVLVVFSSLFYKDRLYTVFVSLLWIGMIFSSLYLKVNGREIANGAIYGIVSTAISYYAVSLL